MRLDSTEHSSAGLIKLAARRASAFDRSFAKAAKASSRSSGSTRSSADGCRVISTFRPSSPLQPVAALGHHRHRAADQRAGRGGSQRHERLGLHERDLVVQPVQAGRGFALGRGLVDAALAAQLELEMLDGVGDEHLLARNAGRFQRAGQQLAGRPDEGMALQVFLVARAARPPASGAPCAWPSPITDWVANSPIGHSRQRMVAAFSSSSDAMPAAGVLMATWLRPPSARRSGGS